MPTITNRCGRCGGNLLFHQEDGGEWRCLQCGRGVQVAIRPVQAMHLDESTTLCLECNLPMGMVTNAKRRYCSDRCRMRAARRRWADQPGERVAV